MKYTPTILKKMNKKITTKIGQFETSTEEEYQILVKKLRAEGLCRHSSYKSPKTGITSEDWITEYQMKKITGQAYC